MPEDNPFDLSERSHAVLTWMVEQDTGGHGVTIPVRSIIQHFTLDTTQTEDVIGELESSGLVSVKTPVSGATVEATHQAVAAVAGNLTFDPAEDVTSVAKALCDEKQSMTGKQLQDATGLEPRRLNFAARHIEGEGLADVQHALGGSDYCFTTMRPTYETRKYIETAQ